MDRITNNNKPDRNALEGGQPHGRRRKAGKVPSPPHPRRRPARRPAQEQSDGLWSGSRDILGSPELRLERADRAGRRCRQPTLPSAAPAPDADASAGKARAPAPARQPGRRPDAPREPASLAHRASLPPRRPAQTQSSSSPRHPPRHPRAAVASPPRRSRYPMRRTRIARSSARVRARHSTVPNARGAQNAAPAADKSRKPRSGGRGRRNVPMVVSSADSIVRDAEILRHEGSTLHVRRMGGELAYIPKAKLRIIPLGGLNEIGKNMTVIEYGNDILVVDCGIGFPDEDEMPGIDLVIPDITYLENNSDRVQYQS